MARPTQFEREEVLEKAMQAFWDQGYCATSMATLVKVTQLKPGSLYAAFDSKEGLFLASLDHYAQRGISRIERTLAEADSPLQGVRNYFQQLARDATQAQARHSCLLVNTVLELANQNERVQQRVNQHLDRIEALFRQALEAAQLRAELAPDRNPQDLATFIMSNIWGLRVLSGTRSMQQRTQIVVNQLLAVFE